MGESRLSLEGMTQAVRDRPALSLALAAGTGLAIGILAGSYATSKFEEDEPPQTKVRPSELQQHTACLNLFRQQPILARRWNR